MATVPDEDDVLELGEAPEVQNEQQPEVNDQGEPEQQDEDEELPSFGDPGDEEQDDSALAKHLRAQIRERDRKIAELDKSRQPEPEIVVGEEPTLESCEYDDDKFKAELRAYDDRKRQRDERANKGREEQAALDRQWDAEKAEYLKKRAALPYRPETINDAELTVASMLDPNQIAIIVKTANNAPALNLALSRAPAKLEAIAGIKDYVKFTAAVVRLETEVKMSKRRPAAEPDKPVRGSASLTNSSVDAQEARLAAAAAKSGDRSALIKYRAEKKGK